MTLIYFVITFSSAVLSGFFMGRSPLRNEIKRGSELVKEDKKTKKCGSENRAEVSSSTVGCGTETQPLTQKNTANANSCSEIDSSCTTPIHNSEAANHKGKMRNGLLFSWALFKRIIPYVLIGSVISAVSAAFLPAEIVEKYVGGNTWYSIPIAAVIGVPLYLRIEMAIPLLKVLIAKGMGMGAAMALVIGGTGASLPEIALISSVLKPKAVIAFVVRNCKKIN